jgi:RecA-family ATPase
MNDVSNFEELLNVSFPTTLFEGKQKPQGKELEPSYRKFISKLSNLIVSESKDIPLMAPCRLKGAYRKDENVIEINQLAFDIDDPKERSFEKLSALMSPYAGCLHTTHSHRPDNPRYRIVLPLSRPVSVSEWRELRENFLFFNPDIAAIIDPVCKEPARAYFLWSAPPKQISNANFFVSIGAPIKPEHFFSRHLKTLSETKPVSHGQLAAGGIKEGARNSSLASYLGGLINRQLSQQETLSLCKQWNVTLQPPLEEAELIKTHQSIWNRHLAKVQTKTPSRQQLFSGADARHNFDLISAADLLSARPKPREYLIDAFLPKKIVAGLFAPGGAGKSTLTLTIAVSVASGLPLFGTFKVKTPGRVVLISGEDDSEEIQRRLHRITETLSDAQKQLVGQNLHILDLADQFQLFTHKPSHGEVEITETPEMIARAIEKHVGGADLLIVDPASRFRGGEENLAADTTRFVQSLQYLRDRLGATLWLVHHVNKNARVNGASQNNSRGSSALIDGLRLGYELNFIERSGAIKLFGDSVADTELLCLRSIKSNYGRPCDPITLQRNSDGTLTVFNQNPAEARRNRLLSDIGASGLTKTQFRDRFAGVKGALGLSEKALMAEISALVAEGLVIAPDRGVMTLSEEGLNRVGAAAPTGSERAVE